MSKLYGKPWSPNFNKQFHAFFGGIDMWAPPSERLPRLRAFKDAMLDPQNTKVRADDPEMAELLWGEAINSVRYNFTYRPQIYIAFKPVQMGDRRDGFREEYDQTSFADMCKFFAFSASIFHASDRYRYELRDLLEGFGDFLSCVRFFSKSEKDSVEYKKPIKLNTDDAREVVRSISSIGGDGAAECLLRLMPHIADAASMQKAYDAIYEACEPFDAYGNPWASRIDRENAGTLAAAKKWLDKSKNEAAEQLKKQPERKPGMPSSCNREERPGNRPG